MRKQGLLFYPEFHAEDQKLLRGHELREIAYYSSQRLIKRGFQPNPDNATKKIERKDPVASFKIREHRVTEIAHPFVIINLKIVWMSPISKMR